MNHSKRARLALAIIRKRHGQRNSICISVQASEADTFRPGVRRAAEQTLAALTDAFPYDALERLLKSHRDEEPAHSREPTRRSDPEEATANELIKSLEANLRELLTAWCDETEEERKELEQALFAVLLAGLAAAFVKWCEKHGVRARHSATESTTIREILRNEAADLLNGVYSRVRKDMEAVITDGLLCGDSPEELVERVRGHLGDDEYETKIASTLEDQKVTEAFHKGALRLNQLAGAEYKQWLVVPDGGACRVCYRYEGEGEVDLDYEYAPGVDTPPAHAGCRCEMYYRGVESGDLDALVDSTM